MLTKPTRINAFNATPIQNSALRGETNHATTVNVTGMGHRKSENPQLGRHETAMTNAVMTAIHAQGLAGESCLVTMQ
jgi:hypothetical protein